MEHFGLVDAIRTYCTENNIVFVYGNEQYANIEAEFYKYEPEQLILICDFSIVPTFTNGRITQLNYTGLMMLGQKREETTESSLDETPIQKYDRRLKYLSTQVGIIISSIACTNELDISNVNLRYDLNKFDLNADFVACNLTFIQ